MLGEGTLTIKEFAFQVPISVRIRQVKEGVDFRLYQVRKPKNRHLVDIRLVDVLPEAQRVSGILVMSPAELVASKVIALGRRRGSPKSGTDFADLTGADLPDGSF